jgi:hypothetical protein
MTKGRTVNAQTLELIEQPEREISAPVAAVATPAMLLQIAVERGQPLDYVERLMRLQERYEANESRKAYNESFAAFKAEAVTIIKNRQVTDGPLKNKRYAELFAVVNAVTPALSRHGLSASWKLTKDERDWIEVTCTVKHVAGHSESVSMGGPPDSGGAKNKIMERASTVSYLERYTLKAILGLSEQDDDNNGGSARDEWVQRAEETTDEKALNALVREASAEFNKARDAKGLGTFMFAVTKHREFLKEVASRESSV